MSTKGDWYGGFLRTDQGEREQRLRDLYLAHAQQVLAYALRRGPVARTPRI